jgi:hypothetical protein
MTADERDVQWYIRVYSCGKPEVPIQVATMRGISPDERESTRTEITAADSSVRRRLSFSAVASPNFGRLDGKKYSIELSGSVTACLMASKASCNTY